MKMFVAVRSVAACSPAPRKAQLPVETQKDTWQEQSMASLGKRQSHGTGRCNFSTRNQTQPTVLASARSGLQYTMQVENEPFKRLLTSGCKAKPVLDYGSVMEIVITSAVHLNTVTQIPGTQDA